MTVDWRRAGPRNRMAHAYVDRPQAGFVRLCLTPNVRDEAAVSTDTATGLVCARCAKLTIRGELRAPEVAQ